MSTFGGRALVLLAALPVALVGAATGLGLGGMRDMHIVGMAPIVAIPGLVVALVIGRWRHWGVVPSLLLCALLPGLLGLPLKELDRRSVEPDFIYVPAMGYTEDLRITMPVQVTAGEVVRLQSVFTRGPWKQVKYRERKHHPRPHESAPPRPDLDAGQLAWHADPQRDVEFDSIYGEDILGKQVVFRQPGQYRVWAQVPRMSDSLGAVSNIIEVRVVAAQAATVTETAPAPDAAVSPVDTDLP